ncbi:hypothetical protein BDF21DRAFT_457833 [Thamnidium elegans]|nr:hypothetical protein BDF21DRAFT_457833 [Thamnidium elegans]
MDQESYIDAMSKNFLSFLTQLPDIEGDGYLYQDTHELILMENWPAQSPNLNPIGHAWSELSRKLKAKKSSIYNHETLINECKTYWDQMSVEYVQRFDFDKIATGYKKDVKDKGKETESSSLSIAQQDPFGASSSKTIVPVKAIGQIEISLDNALEDAVNNN